MAKLTGLFPFIISLLFYIIVGPVVLLLCVVNELFRLCVTLYLHSKYNGKITLVPNGSDAIWALQRPGHTRMVVTGLKTSQPVQKELLIDTFNNKVLQDHQGGIGTYRIMKYILTRKLGYACWSQDKNFDMMNHVRSMDSQKVYTDEDVKELLSKLGEDMDETKPQWELVIVPRCKEKDGKETSLLMLRFQHAYLDGITCIVLVKEFLTSNFTYFLNPYEFTIPSWKRILFYTNAIIYGPYAFLLITNNKFKSFWPTLPSKNPIGRNYSWTDLVDMTKVRKLRQALGKVSLTTVVENAFISAAKEILPPERLPNDWVVGNIAALLPYPKNNIQNRFTTFLYNIPDNVEDIERIKMTKTAHWEAVTGPHIPLVHWSFQLAGRLPIRMHHLIFAGGSASFMLSNVPFSRTKATLLTNNNEILKVFGYPPQPNDTGLTVSCLTYHDTLQIFAIANTSWLRKAELEEIMNRIPKVIDGWCTRLAIKSQ